MTNTNTTKSMQKLETIIPNFNLRLGEFLEHCTKNNITIDKSYFDWDGHIWVYIDSSISFIEYEYKNTKVRRVRLDFMSTNLNAKLNYVECEYYNPIIDTWIEALIYKRSFFKGGSIL